MARSGLYKSDVRKARDILLAEGRHPSVDAVRVALGNTGSKTTIHKYLKELEEEEGGTARRAAISDVLQDLVERLAGRLHEEAEARVNSLREAGEAREAEHATAAAGLKQQIQALQAEVNELRSALQNEQHTHAVTKGTLQEESIARHTASQQVQDLRERLAENEAHRVSVEEKHAHARQALEHYRTAAKEQREQDLRRHEQQVSQLQAELRQQQQAAVIKQEELTRLNQQGVQLTADLTQARHALYDAQTRTRALEAQLQELQELKIGAADLRRQLVERQAEVATMQEKLALATEKAEAQGNRMRELELHVAQAEARAQTLEQITASLQALLRQQTEPGGNAEAKPAGAKAAKGKARRPE